MSHASVRTEGYRPLRNQSKYCILQMDCLQEKKREIIAESVEQWTAYNCEVNITGNWI